MFDLTRLHGSLNAQGTTADCFSHNSGENEQELP